MNAPHPRLGWSALAALTFALVGCDTSPTPPPPNPNAPTPTNPAQSARDADAKAAQEKEAQDKAKGENEIKSMPVDPPKGASAEKFSAEEVAEIKKLPADEQPVAMAQLMCPVSDQHLGSMGKPLKETADGKTAYLCCDGCEEKFKADPAKYLAKLEKK